MIGPEHATLCSAPCGAMKATTRLISAMPPDAGPAGAGASPFLLAPFAAGAAEIDRRRELLRKRNQRLKIGFDEADLPPEQQLEYIRCLNPACSKQFRDSTKSTKIRPGHPSTVLELHSSRRAVALRLFSSTPIVLLSSSCCLHDFGAAAVYRHRRPCCPLLGCLDPKPEPVLPTAPQVAGRPGAPGAEHRRRVVAAIRHGAGRQLRGHRGGGRQAAGHLHHGGPRAAHQRRPPGAVLGS